MPRSNSAKHTSGVMELAFLISNRVAKPLVRLARALTALSQRMLRKEAQDASDFVTCVERVAKCHAEGLGVILLDFGNGKELLSMAPHGQHMLFDLSCKTMAPIRKLLARRPDLLCDPEGLHESIREIQVLSGEDVHEPDRA